MCFRVTFVPIQEAVVQWCYQISPMIVFLHIFSSLNPVATFFLFICFTFGILDSVIAYHMVYVFLIAQMTNICNHLGIWTRVDSCFIGNHTNKKHNFTQQKVEKNLIFIGIPATSLHLLHKVRTKIFIECNFRHEKGF